MKKRTSDMRLTCGDSWLLGAVLVVSIILVPVTMGVAGPSTEAIVSTPAGEVAIDLAAHGIHVVTGHLGDVVLDVGPEGVRVLSSPCPDGRCLLMGPVDESDDVIVCVPSGITIKAAESPEVDSVVR